MDMENNHRTIEINIKFFSYLVDYSPTREKRVTLSVEGGTTLSELWNRLKIPKKVEKIFLVNETYCSEDKILKQGDVVSILPMIDGG